jgi:ABC-type ATPase involved in cell division
VIATHNADLFQRFRHRVVILQQGHLLGAPKLAGEGWR